MINLTPWDDYYSDLSRRLSINRGLKRKYELTVEKRVYQSETISTYAIPFEFQRFIDEYGGHEIQVVRQDSVLVRHDLTISDIKEIVAKTPSVQQMAARAGHHNATSFYWLGSSDASGDDVYLEWSASRGNGQVISMAFNEDRFSHRVAIATSVETWLAKIADSLETSQRGLLYWSELESIVLS